MANVFKISDTYITFKTMTMISIDNPTKILRIVVPINSLKITSDESNITIRESHRCNDYPISQETYEEIMNIIKETT